MIRSSLLLAIAAGIALAAPAHAAKASIDFAKKSCTAAAKEQPNVKSAKDFSSGMTVNNDYIFVPVRVIHTDGSKVRLMCTFDRGTSEVTSLEAVE